MSSDEMQRKLDKYLDDHRGCELLVLAPGNQEDCRSFEDRVKQSLSTFAEEITILPGAQQARVFITEKDVKTVRRLYIDTGTFTELCIVE